jgi:pimeloyl-ACP methyl ester carboxylesterase
MVACEVAAAYPGRAGRLVLLAPLGLWRDDAPVGNWMLLTPGEMPGHVFRDPECDGAQRMFAHSEDSSDAEARIMARVRLTWAMGATGKFVWPLPDKGLRKRLHRVAAPTLLVWGKDDRLVPPAHADEFARRIAGARVETVDRAGHAPHLERPEPVARLVRDFLDA